MNGEFRQDFGKKRSIPRPTRHLISSSTTLAIPTPNTTPPNIITMRCAMSWRTHTSRITYHATRIRVPISITAPLPAGVGHAPLSRSPASADHPSLPSSLRALHGYHRPDEVIVTAERAERCAVPHGLAAVREGGAADRYSGREAGWERGRADSKYHVVEGREGGRKRGKDATATR